MSDRKTGVRFIAKGKSADIYIYGDIGWDVTAKSFSKDLDALGDVKEMNIRINSFGGDVFDGVAIYNRLVQHKAKKTVYVDGIAASAASVVAMSGDKVIMGEGTQIMIHNAWTFTAGNPAKLREMADRLEACSSQMCNIYVKRTGLEADVIQKWMDEETEFYPEEAIANGFADETHEGEKLAARFDPERHLFSATPTLAKNKFPNRAEADKLTQQMVS